MEKDEFNNILNIDFPEVEADANQYYEYCINKNKKRVIKFYKSFLFIFCALIICTISLTTIFLFKDLVTNPDDIFSGTDHTLIVKYYYNGGTITKKVESFDIETIAYPEYHMTIYDNSVKFDFGAFTTITGVILDGNEYKREDTVLVINELKQNTKYEYTLYFNYEDNEYYLFDSFTTLEKGEFVVVYHDPLKNQYLEVSYKSSDKITIPDLLICHNGFAYHAGKYYVFDGFDISLDKIKDDVQVEVVYDIKEASEINYFDDLYKWFREIEIEKIENITINYFEEQEFVPIVKKECELGKGDGSTINELITELKDERFIDKINGDKFGSINKYYYLNFTINNYEYVMYIPISSQILADGRTISLTLDNYLGSLIGNE